MKALFVVRSNFVHGQEERFNRWYDEVHLNEVLAIKGFSSAQRFRLSPHQVQPGQSHGYLAIYEIDSSDIEATLKNLSAATLNMSDSIDLADVEISVFESTGDERTVTG